MRSPRKTYQPSSRVPWGRFALWLVLSSPLALLSGFGLYAAFRGGFYFLFFVPLLAGCVAAGSALLSVSAGRCRNRWLGAAAGLLAGIVALVSYFQFDLAYQEGLSSLHRLDLLPGHIRLRLETDQTKRFRRTPPDIGQPPNRVGAELFFVLDILFVGLLPVFAGWTRASRPFSEETGRWLHEHTFYLDADDAREMAYALDEEDLAGLAECAQPVAFQPMSKLGQARLYYIPYDPDTPVYLSLKIWDGRPWTLGLTKKLATRVMLTADEAAALAEQLRLPGAKLGPLDVEPVLDQPAGGAPAVAIEDLAPDEAGKTLTRSVLLTLTIIALMPLALALVLAVGLGVYIGLHWSDLGTAAKADAAAVAGAGLIGGLFLTVRYGDGISARIQQRMLAATLRKRPSTLVQPDDPDAMYVGVVPRENWGRVMLDTATDNGLIKIDPRRRELLFEGDRQRWRIPAASIVSCDLDQYGLGGPPQPNEYNVIPLVVLRANRDGKVWEAPLSPLRTTLSRPTIEARRRRCRELHRHIRGELLDRSNQ